MVVAVAIAWVTVGALIYVSNFADAMVAEYHRRFFRRAPREYMWNLAAGLLMWPVVLWIIFSGHAKAEATRDILQREFRREMIDGPRWDRALAPPTPRCTRCRCQLQVPPGEHLTSLYCDRCQGA